MSLLDPTTVRIAEGLPWGYDVVHAALSEAAELGVPPRVAEGALRACACAGPADFVWEGYLRKWRMLRAAGWSGEDIARGRTA